MSEALITPRVLTWARERAQFSHDILAQKIHSKPEKIFSWEAGDSYPTFRQAQLLARALHISFGYLFLSSPPQIELPIPDLRTIGSDQPTELSPDFFAVVNDILRKQHWYKEYLQEEGEAPLPFLGRFNKQSDALKISQDITKTLGIDDSFRRSSTNWEDFLRELMRKSESVGILVFRSGVVGNNNQRKLSVEEFRGFAIADAFAPVVFLNGNDAKAAQIFTLIHELAHLWIGESGISNSDLGRATNHDAQVERLCNQVAAEVLVPHEIFAHEWLSGVQIIDNINTLVRRFRVSSLVILRRALDLNIITPDEFFPAYREELEQQKQRETRRPGESSGDFFATIGIRSSKRLLGTLVSATLEGRVLHRDAARLLGVKVKTLEGIASNLGLR